MSEVTRAVRARRAARRCRPASTCSSCTWRTAICSPPSSRRSPTAASDEFGGDVHGRLRFPLEVLRAVRARVAAGQAALGAHLGDATGPRAAFPRRTSSSSRVPSATPESISSMSRPARPSPGRSRCTAACGRRPFADKVRNEIGIATMAVGNIYEPDHVNSIIASGRADLCAIARPHLANPAWTLDAAARLGYARAVVAAAVSLGPAAARAQPAARRAAAGRRRGAGEALRAKSMSESARERSRAATRSSPARAAASAPPSPRRSPREGARVSLVGRDAAAARGSGRTSSAERTAPSPIVARRHRRGIRAARPSPRRAASSARCTSW